MRLLLFHPGVASYSCDECKKWIYIPETGKRKTYKSGPNRVDTDMPRPVNVPTPCLKCPKESPEKAGKYELSKRSYLTLLLYQRAKATGFHYLTDEEKTDPIVARNFAVLDSLIAEYERKRQAENFVHALLPYLKI